MARSSYVYRDGKVWLRGTEPPSIPVQRSGLPCPNIRPDGMQAIQSMHDGQFYDSRSGYYRSIKEAGCEIVGDDKAPFDAPREFVPDPVAPDIKRAIEELS